MAKACSSGLSVASRIWSVVTLSTFISLLVNIPLGAVLGRVLVMWLQRPPKVPKETNKSHEFDRYCDVSNICI